MRGDLYWSDEFFNYVPTEQAWEASLPGGRQAEELLQPIAEQFREANPACPFNLTG